MEDCGVDSRLPLSLCGNTGTGTVQRQLTENANLGNRVILLVGNFVPKCGNRRADRSPAVAVSSALGSVLGVVGLQRCTGSWRCPASAWTYWCCSSLQLSTVAVSASTRSSTLRGRCGTDPWLGSSRVGSAAGIAEPSACPACLSGVLAWLLGAPCGCGVVGQFCWFPGPPSTTGAGEGRTAW